jgi:hypothetical protein
LSDGFLGILPDHRDRLCGRNVIARNPILFAGHCVEVFLNKLLSPGQSVATAHLEIIADRQRA